MVGSLGRPLVEERRIGQVVRRMAVDLAVRLGRGKLGIAVRRLVAVDN